MALSGGRGGVVVALALVLAMTGCGRDDPTPGTADATASTTTAVPTTAGSGDGRACPDDDPVPPTGATEVTEVTADVDGDGRDDRVLGYRRADGTGRVAVELAGGGTAAVDAGGPPDVPSPLSLLGGADLGGDGETVFAVTGSGASVVVVGLFQFVECALSSVVDQSGRPVELPVGGTVTHGDGIACGDGPGGAGLVQRSAASSDGERFETSDTRFRVDGNTTIEVGADRGTLHRSTAGDQVDRYYTLDCPGLERGIGA